MASRKLLDPRFLLLSLGNPKPYTDTLHSAGHHALRALQADLPAQPAFSKTEAFGKPCQASVGDKFTLVQSPTLMNVSGNFAHGAWKRALSRESEPERLHMVFVHDDMEEELGTIKLREYKTSHRGHNGMKDVKAQMQEKKYPGARWAKISIGIGRPISRKGDSVTRWVLRPMTEGETVTIERESAAGIMRCLDEWMAKFENQAKRAEALAAARLAARSDSKSPSKTPSKPKSMSASDSDSDPA
ncbi:peptidyl-trna hydrolase [Colletotrichum plurivorum]|uniref:peptidyl-tRNA hydrolase n=1 Tax=Colletotrichum plurivorum TaxID=2175906 RepID=A0A8H6JMH1_9PEZI|nr:peptidyl-trna hydrolase [Colletotrichum plurivorum]